MIGDEIEVSSHFSDLGRSSCIRHDMVTRVSDGAALARGQARWVWMDLESFQPVPIPAGYLAPLMRYFVEREAG